MSAPPHNLEAEQGVIAAVLLSERALRPLVVDEGLRPAAFYRPEHQQVFAAMLALADRGEPVDEITITAELDRRGEKPAAAAIDEAVTSSALASNGRSYARLVVKLADLRAVADAGRMLAAAAQQQDHDGIVEAERLLATRGRTTTEQVTEQQLSDLVFEYLAGEELELFTLPWPSLNRGCGGGLRRSQVTAVGGWTGHGKSVLTDQILAHVARQHGARTHLYINEMSVEERALRNAAREAGVSYERLQLKQLHGDEHARVKDALNAGFPFGITDAAGATAAEIARDIRWNQWDIAAVDILHNIEFRDERELSNAMQALVAAALQARCHLLVTVHLNEERAKQAILPSPVKRDIRGSGMVKNLAHNVLFVYREQHQDDPEADVEYTGDARIFWDKTRSGGGGFQAAVFRGDRQRIDMRAAA